MHHVAPFEFAGHSLQGDAAGSLYWPARRTLIVSDLHFEKGSAMAQRRHRHVPPYDTRATLAALGMLIERYEPAQVICLGDSFHDLGAFARMDEGDCATLASFACGRDWVWITGNHDPLPNGCFGGRVEDVLTLDGITFRHQAESESGFEVSGHYHPKASIVVANSRVSGRCFVVDDTRLIMPAFGAFTGGLNVLDPAIRGWLSEDFSVVLIGRERVVRMPSRRLVA